MRPSSGVGGIVVGLEVAAELTYSGRAMSCSPKRFDAASPAPEEYPA